MAKRGNIFYTDKDFTDSEVQQQFGFPVILILHDNNSVIKKISAFDENGIKSIYDFSLSASKQFVTDSIATAISNIKDNTLEFPTFADFPQPGEVGNVYIDLAEDKIYIWDSASSTYISQSWNQSIITSIQTQITALQNSKLDKGSYVGTAQDLKNSIDNLQIGGRNFLRNSKNFAGLTNWNINGNPVITQNADYITLDLPANSPSVGLFQPLDLGGYAGDITISFDAKSASNGWLYDLNIGIEGKSAKTNFGINDVTTWTRFSFTLNLATVTNYCVFIFYKGGDNVNLGLHLKNIKLEKGNKATDWTPAPEDKQDSLQDIVGNVGVGKTNASSTEKLEVNGNIKADNLKAKSTQFQLQSSINPTPNTLVPKTDGSSLIWYNNSSIENNIPFIPYGWVFGLGSGSLSSNTAIGNNALANNTGGNENTAIGFYALANNVNGFRNTAIGYYALSSNTNGRENTAIGYSALAINTAGRENTAIGYYALANNDNGFRNVAVGNYSQKYSSGKDNCSFGESSLAYAGSAVNNSVFGSGSGYTCYGNSNSAFGYNSLYYCSGANNVAIGALSAYNIGSGNKCVFIGAADSISLNTPNSTNMIAIGFNVAGKGSNTVELGNDSISNTYLKGKVNLNNRLKLASYTKAQRDDLTNKEVGDMIWQTDSGNSGIRVFDGTNWLAVQTVID